jgi:hypothetical protein
MQDKHTEIIQKYTNTKQTKQMKISKQTQNIKDKENTHTKQINTNIKK